MADVYSTFKAQYQYRIAGQFNAGFSNLARAVDDDATAARLKSRLTSNTIQITQIKNSGDTADNISKKVGQLQLGYVRTATQALYAVRSDTEKLSAMRGSLGSISKDLEASVNEYLKSNTRTAADDAQFKQNAEYALRKLSAIYVTAKGRSAAAGTRFDISLYQTDRRLDALKALLANFPPAGSSAPAAADAGGDDGSVAPASGAGENLDITA